jgi:hypothetical protein
MNSSTVSQAPDKLALTMGLIFLAVAIVSAFLTVRVAEMAHLAAECRTGNAINWVLAAVGACVTAYTAFNGIVSLQRLVALRQRQVSAAIPV